MVLWKSSLSQKNFCHFAASKALAEEDSAFSGENYIDVTMYRKNFADLKRHIAAFQIFANPFIVMWKQSISNLKAKFRDVNGEAEKMYVWDNYSHPFTGFPVLCVKVTNGLCFTVKKVMFKSIFKV